MKIRIFIIIFLGAISISTKLNAQIVEVDSLEYILKQHIDQDTVRVNLLNEIALKLFRVNNDKLFEYATQSNALANKLSFARGKAKSLFLLGLYWQMKAEIPKALKYYNKSLEYYKELGNKKRIAFCLNNIGLIYKTKGNYSYALECFRQSLEIAKELKSKQTIAYCLNNIGTIYKYQENYPVALDYYQKSLKIKKEINDKRGILENFINVGKIYKMQGDYLLALEYYQKSLKISEEINDKFEIPLCLNNIGEINLIQGSYDTALKCFLKSLKINDSIGNKEEISISFYYMAKLYFETNRYEKALNYNLKSLSLTKEHEILEGQAKNYQLLSKIYNATKKYKKAYQSLLLYKELSDSMFNENNVKKITSLELLYKYNEEKKISDLEQQKKDIVYAEEIKQQKRLINIFIFGFLIAISIIFLVFRLFTIKKKANIILHQKNEKILLQKDVILLQKQDLENKTEELFQHNEHLDEMVDKRTAELVISKQKAEESDKLKTEFIRNLSHEIRTPMNGILGFSNILNKPNLTAEKRKQYIDIIQNSGRNLMLIIDNILEISKLETKQIIVENKQVCLNKLLVKLFNAFEEKAKKKKIELYLKKALPNHESTIITDSILLNKILSNLLENALKFTLEGFVELGYKLVKTHDHASQLEIYVKDTGIGIKPESQQTIFSSFSQEEKGLSRNVGGIGLGLPIAKENAKLLGGKITLKSEKGKGAIFLLTIPYNPVI